MTTLNHTNTDHGTVAVSVARRNSDNSLFCITVIVKNASHKAWKGAGRTFSSFEDALSAYKNGKVLGAIIAAM